MAWLPPINCRVYKFVFSGACSTITFSQLTSNSSATITDIEVVTLCPPSGLGDMIVTRPLSPIFQQPFISNHSLGRAEVSPVEGLHPASQLKLSIIPPPASTDTFKKDLRLMLVLISVMVERGL